MATEEATVAKKVFKTATKAKKEEVNRIKKDSKNELKDDSSEKRATKPKQKETKIVHQTEATAVKDPSSGVIEAKVAEGAAKKPRKRRPRAKNAVKTGEEQLSKGIEEINLSSPSLSAEAAPFTPISEIKSPKLPLKPRKPVSRPAPKTEKDGDLRSVEVKQLQIRFSPTGFALKKMPEDDSVKIQCVMPITDPDFAYDLATIRLEIILPRGYPGTKTSPIRPIFSLLNSDIPAPIISRIERNLKWGLNSLDGGVLVCRPMLRYLEDNVEKWMVDDVREAAFKFVKPSEIKVTQKDTESEASDGGDSEDSDNLQYASESNSQIISQSQTQSRCSKGDWIAPPPVSDQSSVGGTPFTLKLFFSNIRGIDLLTSQRLTFLSSCDRCRFNFPVEDLRPFVDRIEHCPKCTNQTKFYYQSQLVTPGANFDDAGDEFEGILGSVRFLRAKPVDLLPSLYQCACARCFGSEGEDQTSSSCKIEKVKIGENIGYSCFNCHQKIRFQIDRIEWCNDSVPASPSSKQKGAAKASGPTLTVGNPLPNSGACEHYKKSFRWYRFPCCGQAFPCDECHAKDPVAKAHPVEWANRFICGFCSREQSISVKECPECGKNTSASGRRATTFWEGGKGARNQILMSRKDSKKYKDYGTTVKTIVKKSKKGTEE